MVLRIKPRIWGTVLMLYHSTTTTAPQHVFRKLGLVYTLQHKSYQVLGFLENTGWYKEQAGHQVMQSLHKWAGEMAQHKECLMLYHEVWSLDLSMCTGQTTNSWNPAPRDSILSFGLCGHHIHAYRLSKTHSPINTHENMLKSLLDKV